MTHEPQCPHVTLKRRNVGDWHWYECPVCGQKFKVPRNPGMIEPWDGKVRVVTHGGGDPSQK